ncbi:hypothetical protein, partial [Candidatus Mycobacterium methanotrophicum]|uniref:hypothetical protein n=1 Tax=Candidatus Mycobacterium methanotrophicum TaxID=2943498 RepID=UPI001C5A3F7D
GFLVETESLSKDPTPSHYDTPKTPVTPDSRAPSEKTSVLQVGLFDGSQRSVGCAQVDRLVAQPLKVACAVEKRSGACYSATSKDCGVHGPHAGDPRCQHKVAPA